ncbi:hypothetical protein I79_017186 [Cricetulus griseus]|uniref:Uncharacterized protein n=1 Tax=Cricetulus griseus TaxID=10029 RepID=G3I1D3_CRIGR|nr:hypothetical protein I79_017186 [Cricetulus griseus]
MEPPIHELNLRSTVVLFAISFNRMLCNRRSIRILGQPQQPTWGFSAEKLPGPC